MCSTTTVVVRYLEPTSLQDFCTFGQDEVAGVVEVYNLEYDFLVRFCIFFCTLWNLIIGFCLRMLVFLHPVLVRLICCRGEGVCVAFVSNTVHFVR